MIKIKIPATTANMGPGFDCLGMALNLYNEIDIEEISEGCIIEVAEGDPVGVPLDETNLIYETMLSFCEMTNTKLKGVHLKQYNRIPITRGLGSSAACIVGGLLAANALTGANLSKQRLAEMASMIEGHPDNVAPAILGGMVIAAQNDQAMKCVQIPVPEQVRCVVMVPDFKLSTEKARDVLPQTLPMKDSIYNISRAALLVGSMMSGNLDNLDFAMEDVLHQPYRQQLIPNMEEIFTACRELGAKGVFLSGAGPTLIALIDSNYDEFVNNISLHLKQYPVKWDVNLLEVDPTGATIEELA